DLLYQKKRIEELIDRSHKSVAEIFFKKEIDLARDIEEGIGEIEIDPDQITQVLINLLKNAAEAVQEKGTVGIRARKYRGEHAEVVREKGNPLVLLEVYDNGSGIDRRDVSKIFEPFYSMKVGGTGLGLFVTHSIIQHHQGRITVSSKPGQGTTFRVFLPMTRPSKGG
ncbi:MAG TPA: ATP-binding protein, partial [Candidatus Krumholzibacterium sp.]|nr:ATP-binding protein [Candidatus Krumholzibacterium sp.]